jgi:hypothetical protein
LLDALRKLISELKQIRIPAIADALLKAINLI